MQQVTLWWTASQTIYLTNLIDDWSFESLNTHFNIVNTGKLWDRKQLKEIKERWDAFIE